MERDRNQNTSEHCDEQNLIESEEQETIPKLSIVKVSYKIWVWVLAIFFNFMATLCVFPALTVLVQSTNPGNTWSDTYFIPVGCFLTFNVGDFIGRTLAGLIKLPKATNLGGGFILALAFLRLGFIPAFLFCNAAPNSRELTEVSLNCES